MAESMATGWYFAPSGAAPGGRVGPLTWNELWAARCSGSLQPADLVWHPTLSDWTPATEVQGLFPAAVAPPAYQPAAYEQGAYPTAARSGSRVLAWLIPLIALIIVGGGIGAYFGFFYNKNGEGDANIELESLYGTWEGTLVYKSLDIKSDVSDEDKELRDRVLNTEIPVTMELSDAGTGDNAAHMSMDMSVIDPSMGETSEDMTFTYSDGKVAFESGTSGGIISATVKEKGDELEMRGEMEFDDSDTSSTVAWTVTKKKGATSAANGSNAGGQTTSGVTGQTTATAGGSTGGAGESTGVSDSSNQGVTGDFDLNGTWVGTWTFTSIEAASDQEDWDKDVNRPMPLTMEVSVDESGTGTADCSIDEGETGEYKTHVDFIYSDGKLECVGWDYDIEGIPCTSQVTRQGNELVWEGTFDYKDLGNLKYKAVWIATKR
jgi:hypothetical protein